MTDQLATAPWEKRKKIKKWRKGLNLIESCNLLFFLKHHILRIAQNEQFKSDWRPLPWIQTDLNLWFQIRYCKWRGRRKKIKRTTKRINFDIKAYGLLHMRNDPIMDTSIHREKWVPTECYWFYVWKEKQRILCPGWIRHCPLVWKKSMKRFFTFVIITEIQRLDLFTLKVTEGFCVDNIRCTSEM